MHYQLYLRLSEGMKTWGSKAPIEDKKFSPAEDKKLALHDGIANSSLCGGM